MARAAGALFGAHISFVDHFLNQPVEQLIEILFAHAFELLTDLFGALGIENIAARDGFFQAALQFFLFTGREAPIELMRQVIRRTISAVKY